MKATQQEQLPSPLFTTKEDIFITMNSIQGLQNHYLSVMIEANVQTNELKSSFQMILAEVEIYSPFLLINRILPQ